MFYRWFLLKLYMCCETVFDDVKRSLAISSKSQHDGITVKERKER